MDPFVRSGNVPADGIRDRTTSIPYVGRRQVLVAAGSVALLGGLAAVSSSLADNPARLPSTSVSRSFAFFSPGEVSFIDAAVDRLIPSDALGPGAVEAGVTVFIDRQLQGPYGRAADWYMQGPWADGTPQQGYQRRRTPAELYRAAIALAPRRAHAYAWMIGQALRPTPSRTS